MNSALITLAQESSGGGAAGVLIVFVLVALAFAAYWIWMLVDVVRRDEAELRAGSKLIWVVVIVLTGAIGALIYQLVGRPKAT